jgi:hypothetical protein
LLLRLLLLLSRAALPLCLAFFLERDTWSPSLRRFNDDGGGRVGVAEALVGGEAAVVVGKRGECRWVGVEAAEAALVSPLSSASGVVACAAAAAAVANCRDGDDDATAMEAAGVAGCFPLLPAGVWRGLHDGMKFNVPSMLQLTCKVCVFQATPMPTNNLE